MESVLNDVIECTIDRILEEFSSEFEDGVKCAWPGSWNESPNACREYLEKHGCTGKGMNLLILWLLGLVLKL
jgi:hypothetical protein